MPLQASSMPTTPVAISMTLPRCTDGISSQPSNSTVIPVVARVRAWNSGPSNIEGHDTAIRKKKTGKRNGDGGRERGGGGGGGGGGGRWGRWVGWWGVRDRGGVGGGWKRKRGKGRAG